jgi:putative endonuclease
LGRVRGAAPWLTWFVYLVRCSDGTLYCGITTEINRRIAEHNSGKGAKYTRSRAPVTLVYLEESPTRSSASKREAAIKKMSRSKKEDLCRGVRGC